MLVSQGIRFIFQEYPHGTWKLSGKWLWLFWGSQFTMEPANLPVKMVLAGIRRAKKPGWHHGWSLQGGSDVMCPPAFIGDIQECGRISTRHHSLKSQHEVSDATYYRWNEIDAGMLFSVAALCPTQFLSQSLIEWCTFSMSMSINRAIYRHCSKKKERNAIMRDHPIYSLVADSAFLRRLQISARKGPD